tara:strand:- start:13 stop:732 length:720 start_codon:yes stop_codon:yes gene_type:complete
MAITKVSNSVLNLSGNTDALGLPKGTDAQRPTPVAGMLRFNTETSGFEGYDGTEWGAIGGTGSTLVQDEFAGDGTTVAFTLSVSVVAEIFTSVYISGVYQEKNAYSISGTTLTFSVAPPNGASIEVITIDNITVEAIVTSVDGQTGAVSTNYDAQVISTNTNALKNTVYVLTADLTLTLPASPVAGDSIKISNQSAVATCIIARNGSNIMGLALDLTLDDPTKNFELIFTNAAKGWVII